MSEEPQYEPGEFLYAERGNYLRPIVDVVDDECSEGCPCRVVTPDGGDEWGERPNSGAMRWKPGLPEFDAACACGCGAGGGVSAEEMEAFRIPFAEHAERYREVPF